ncbi:hypothetical protein CPL00345_CDS0179 [Klebsiella phage GlastoCabaret]
MIRAVPFNTPFSLFSNFHKVTHGGGLRGSGGGMVVRLPPLLTISTLTISLGYY